MKNRFLLGLIFLAFHSYLIAQNDLKDISESIDHWHLAAAQADFDTYFSLMTSESVFIGTDASENWPLEEFKAFSKPYFDKGKAWSFTAVERNIYIAPTGDLAWFDELLDTWMGICRGSGVVRKEDNRWKIAHYVLSATVPNDDMQQLIELKKTKDSLLLETLDRNQ